MSDNKKDIKNNRKNDTVENDPNIYGKRTSNLKFLWQFTEGNRLRYIVAVIFLFAASLMSVTMPLVSQITIDSVLGEKDFDLPGWILSIINAIGGRDFIRQNLWLPGAILLAMAGLYGVFVFIRCHTVSKISEDSAKNMRRKLYHHLLHLPQSYHATHNTGDLLQRCTSDVEIVQAFLPAQFIEILALIINIAFILVSMFTLNTFLAFTGLSLVPFMLILTIIMFKKIRENFKLAQECEAELTSDLQEALTGIQVIKAFGAQKFELDRFEKFSTKLRNRQMKNANLRASFWSITNAIGMMQYVLQIGIGIYLAVVGFNGVGDVSVGTFVTFITYTNMVIWPLRSLGQLFTFMGQALVSANRLTDILDAKAEQDTPDGSEAHEPYIEGNIKFDHVGFTYPDDTTPVLKDLSFEIERGKTVAILGSTGSGKTTITQLLTRLYDYTEGSITVDGYELNHISRKHVRDSFGIVLQDPYLFTRSIKENIILGNYGANEFKMRNSAKIAAVHDTISEFSEGYNTVVGERGVTVSGGQKQRIAIARIVIRDVPVLIFDDSLSAVDTETDKAIRAALRDRSADTTTIIISHRITTLADADKILVLDGGRIVQEGTHEELKEQEGLYRRICELQDAL